MHEPMPINILMLPVSHLEGRLRMTGSFHHQEGGRECGQVVEHSCVNNESIKGDYCDCIYKTNAIKIKVSQYTT